MYRLFYRLPPRWRRRLVRLGTATYTVGAVVLAIEAPAEAREHAATGGTGAGEAAGAGEATGAGRRLLLVRQASGKGWSLPAGLLQRGEPPAAAAARELAEETGVAIAISALSPATPNAVVHTRGRWIDVVFTASVPRGTPIRPDGTETFDVAWHPLDRLPALTPSTARLLAYYGLGPNADQRERADG